MKLAVAPAAPPRRSGGVLYLPCHTYNDASGGTTPWSYQVDDWFVAEARGHVMLRLADHVALDGGVALRYMRRLFDDAVYPNAGGAIVSIALGAWL